MRRDPLRAAANSRDDRRRADQSRHNNPDNALARELLACRSDGFKPDGAVCADDLRSHDGKSSREILRRLAPGVSGEGRIGPFCRPDLAPANDRRRESRYGGRRPGRQVDLEPTVQEAPFEPSDDLPSIDIFTILGDALSP